MIKLIHQLSYHHSTSKVFSDFVEMSAISFSNALDKGQFEDREKRYLEIVKNYKKEEVYEFPKLLGMLINHLEETPQDVLGELFHALELHNERKGQFFTPYPICRMMAKMTIGSSHEEIMDKYGFINLYEPACGTGAMVIATAQELKDRNINYQQAIHVMATDIDPTCVYASYVQFTLLHIPAVVVHGDSLSMEVFSQWLTPSHIMGLWDHRIERKQQQKKLRDFIISSSEKENEIPDVSIQEIVPPKDSLRAGQQLKIF